MPAGKRSRPDQQRATVATGQPSLQFSEVLCDLFKYSRSASLVHCVSEDMCMGKGIATAFKKKFGGVDELKAQGWLASEIASHPPIHPPSRSYTVSCMVS